MRNKLLSLERNTTALPYVEQGNLIDQTLAANGEATFNPNLSNSTSNNANFVMVVPDDTIIEVPVGNKIDIGGNALTFVAEQDIPQASAHFGVNFQIQNTINLTTQRTLTLTFISVSTGAYRSVNVVLEPVT